MLHHLRHTIEVESHVRTGTEDGTPTTEDVLREWPGGATFGPGLLDRPKNASTRTDSPKVSTKVVMTSTVFASMDCPVKDDDHLWITDDSGQRLKWRVDYVCVAGSPTAGNHLEIDVTRVEKG